MTTATAAVAREVSALKEWVTKNLSLLQQAGVTKIAGSYRGMDDDGSFDGLAVEPHTAAVNIPPKKLTELDRAMDDALDFIDHGYAAGDGGGGTITLDVATGRLSVDSYRNTIVKDPELEDFEI